MEKILVTIPDDLLDKLNSMAKYQKKKRGHVIREAIEYYINKEKQQEQEKLLIEGYREMLKENEQDVEAYVKILNDI